MLKNKKSSKKSERSGFVKRKMDIWEKNKNKL